MSIALRPFAALICVIFPQAILPYQFWLFTDIVVKSTTLADLPFIFFLDANNILLNFGTGKLVEPWSTILMTKDDVCAVKKLDCGQDPIRLCSQKLFFVFL